MTTNNKQVTYEKAVYLGRIICDKRYMGSAYCGPCSFKTHLEQMKDKKSWVHSSKESWLRVWAEEQTKKEIDLIRSNAEQLIDQIIEVRLESLK